MTSGTAAAATSKSAAAPEHYAVRGSVINGDVGLGLDAYATAKLQSSRFDAMDRTTLP